MKHKTIETLIGVALLAFVAVAGADELTVNSILAAQRSGAPADGIIAMVNNPANTVAMAEGDLVTLRSAGVPEMVISAIWARIPPPAPMPQQPDDVRLVDLVRLIDSGMSDSNVAAQVKQSGQVYNPSVNDLLYLKQNGAGEVTIAALMGTRAETPAVQPAAPDEVTFDNLVLVKKTGFWRYFRGNREGRLVLRGDTLTWDDNSNSSENFTFQTTGLEKVWLTCEARSSGNFCYQINFQIVRGDLYRFRDIQRESGSNAAVLRVMEALRTYFPRLTFAKESVDN